MKITVESTDEFRLIDGRYCRVWKGTDTKGQKLAIVTVCLVMDHNADQSEMKKDLRDVPMTGLEQTWMCTRKDIDGGKKKKKK